MEHSGIGSGKSFTICESTINATKLPISQMNFMLHKLYLNKAVKKINDSSATGGCEIKRNVNYDSQHTHGRRARIPNAPWPSAPRSHCVSESPPVSGKDQANREAPSIFSAGKSQ